MIQVLQISILNLTFLPTISLFVGFGRSSTYLLPRSAISTPNETTALRSLDTAPQAHILIQDERPDDPDPAAVTRERLIELFRDAVKLMKPRPRDGREIVVLVVQADIVCQDVQGPIVGVCLWWRKGVQRVWLLLLLAGSAVRPHFPLLFNAFCTAALHPGEEVVLGDKVTSTGVERAGEEGAEEQIE